MDINATKEKVVGFAKDTADKVVSCAKDCTSKVQSKVKGAADVVAKNGKGLTYNALNTVCSSKWLIAAEHAIVGALNKLASKPVEVAPVAEESTARKEEVVI